MHSQLDARPLNRLNKRLENKLKMNAHSPCLWACRVYVPIGSSIDATPAAIRDNVLANWFRENRSDCTCSLVAHSNDRWVLTERRQSRHFRWPCAPFAWASCADYSASNWIPLIFCEWRPIVRRRRSHTDRNVCSDCWTMMWSIAANAGSYLLVLPMHWRRRCYHCAHHIRNCCDIWMATMTIPVNRNESHSARLAVQRCLTVDVWTSDFCQTFDDKRCNATEKYQKLNDWCHFCANEKWEKKRKEKKVVIVLQRLLLIIIIANAIRLKRTQYTECMAIATHIGHGLEHYDCRTSPNMDTIVAKTHL